MPRSRGGFVTGLAAVIVGTTLSCGEADANKAGSGGASGAGGKAGAGGSSGGAGSNTAGRGGQTGAGGNVAPSGGGGTGGNAGMGAVAPPSDPRPQNPNRVPSLPVGEAGWEGSTVPLCEPMAGEFRGFSTWADARGVYTLFGTKCGLEHGPCVNPGVSLQFNDGSGWKWLSYDAIDGDELRLGGFAGGPLLITGAIGDEGGVFFLENGKRTLSYSTTSTYGVTSFVAGSGRAYVASGQQVFEYRDGAWKELATLPELVSPIWADGDVVAVFGQDVAYARTAVTEAIAPLARVPVGIYRSAWGFGANDYWAGNSVGQLVHFDGKAWSTLETGSVRSIKGMWGRGSTLYFITDTEMGRVQSGHSELIVPESVGESFESIWGRAENEVFVSIAEGDGKFDKYACGSAFMLWFDGTAFHQF
ncbi:MAG: hypothetical protein ACOY0T_14980 [Myxococcota bacterium]